MCYSSVLCCTVLCACGCVSGFASSWKLQQTFDSLSKFITSVFQVHGVWGVVLCCVVKWCVVLCCVVCWFVLCWFVLRCVLCCVVLCCVVLCCVALCCVVM